MARHWLAPEELRRLQRLGRLLLLLILMTLMITVSTSMLAKVGKFPTMSKGYIIGVAVYSGMVTVIAATMLFAKGGAEAYLRFLNVLSLTVYVLSLFCLYLTGMLIFFLTGLARRDDKYTPEDRTKARVFSALTMIGFLVIVGVSLRLPALSQFLKEFKESPKSRKIKLIKIAFVVVEKVDEDERVILDSSEAEVN
jgi:hypothetical protein